MTGPRDWAATGPDERRRQLVGLFARTLSETTTRQRDKLVAADVKRPDRERAGRSRADLVTRPNATTALKESGLRPRLHVISRLLSPASDVFVAAAVDGTVGCVNTAGRPATLYRLPSVGMPAAAIV